MDRHSTYQGRKSAIFKIVTVLLLALWIPVGIDKATNFRQFRDVIQNQPFSGNLKHILVYILPMLELTTTVCLVFEKWQKAGLVLSTALMTAFTGYVGLVLLGAWKESPCGCGSVISGMSWKQHFFFNLFFLLLSILGFYLWNKLRRGNAGRGTTEGGSAKRHTRTIF